MTSYFDCSDAEGQDLGESEQDAEREEALAWFASLESKASCWDECTGCGAYFPAGSHCDNCIEELPAADGGEGDDMSEDNSDVLFGGFVKPLKECSPISLVSMRNAIDTELKQRRELLAKELAATEHALNGTRPRATRRDKGTTRAPKEHAA